MSLTRQSTWCLALGMTTASVTTTDSPHEFRSVSEERTYPKMSITGQSVNDAAADLESQISRPTIRLSIQEHSTNGTDSCLSTNITSHSEWALRTAKKSAKPIATISGVVLAITTLFLTLVAWEDSHISTKIALWTARKDFLERCMEVIDMRCQHQSCQWF